MRLEKILPPANLVSPGVCRHVLYSSVRVGGAIGGDHILSLWFPLLGPSEEKTATTYKQPRCCLKVCISICYYCDICYILYVSRQLMKLYCLGHCTSNDLNVLKCICNKYQKIERFFILLYHFNTFKSLRPNPPLPLLGLSLTSTLMFEETGQKPKGIQPIAHARGI